MQIFNFGNSDPSILAILFASYCLNMLLQTIYSVVLAFRMNLQKSSLFIYW